MVDFGLVGLADNVLFSKNKFYEYKFDDDGVHIVWISSWTSRRKREDV